VDVVLSDVVMPVMGGAELVKRLADRWPGLPVVSMSGCIREVPFGDGPVREHRPFRQKPIQEAVLARVLAGEVERPRS
jgi:CheY-like chemotaxis protein